MRRNHDRRKAEMRKPIQPGDNVYMKMKPGKFKGPIKVKATSKSAVVGEDNKRWPRNKIGRVKTPGKKKSKTGGVECYSWLHIVSW